MRAYYSFNALMDRDPQCGQYISVYSGQSAGLVNAELEACKFHILMDPVKIQYVPSEESLKELSDKVAAVE